MLSVQDVQGAILKAIENINLSRPADGQLPVSPDATIFGPGSSLDSLGLVALLIELEDLLRDKGVDLTLSDDRAMSQRSSPFRDVPALTSYILSLSGPSQ
jgi:hypothetical protein